MLWGITARIRVERPGGRGGTGRGLLAERMISSFTYLSSIATGVRLAFGRKHIKGEKNGHRTLI